MKIIVTGGAGFIGAHVIKYLIANTDHTIVNLDKLTYAANLTALTDIQDDSRYSFIQGDIADAQLVGHLFNSEKPDAVMHLAAESHVDKSIDSSGDFIHTNIFGTYILLEQARKYWLALDKNRQSEFRFQHISTDEVFGSLDNIGLFNESTPYNPSSPYSASKASADHLVRAWHHTYKLPVLLTNCSNNYGPYQHSEKLIPKTIQNALASKPIPVYGSGKQIRDWLYVQDHADALYKVLTTSKVGETYNIGGSNEKTNLEVVTTICNILDKSCPQKLGKLSSYKELITHVEDRAGHDFRYGIDASKIKRDLHWYAQQDFMNGIEKTVQWYLDNLEWLLQK